MDVQAFFLGRGEGKTRVLKFWKVDMDVKLRKLKLTVLQIQMVKIDFNM